MQTYKQTNMHTHTCKHTHTHTHTHTHIHTLTQAHTHMHTHSHTHIQTRAHTQTHTLLIGGWGPTPLGLSFPLRLPTHVVTFTGLFCMAKHCAPNTRLMLLWSVWVLLPW